MSGTASTSHSADFIRGVLMFVWTIGTLCLDASVATVVFEQTASIWYDRAAGTVVASEIEEDRDAESGTSFLWKGLYVYVVAGDRYKGDRVRSSTVRAGSGRKLARERLQKYPLGADVVVYHSPTKPHIALLEPGLSSGELYQVLFAAPFNALMVVGLWLTFGTRWRLTRDLPPVGAELYEEGERWTIRLGYPSWFGLLLGFSGATFLGAIAGGILVGTTQLESLVVLLALVTAGTLLFIAGIGAAAPRNGSSRWTARNVDSNSSTSATEVRAPLLLSISNASTLWKRPSPILMATAHRYSPTLRVAGETFVLCDKRSLASAETLANWLTRQLRDSASGQHYDQQEMAPAPNREAR